MENKKPKKIIITDEVVFNLLRNSMGQEAFHHNFHVSIKLMTSLLANAAVIRSLKRDCVLTSKEELGLIKRLKKI